MEENKTPLQELEEYLDYLQQERFMLDMKDRWSSSDWELSDLLSTKIRKCKRDIEDMKKMECV